MFYKNELFMNDLCCIAQEAGKAILRFYNEDIMIEHKADNSPVTAADLAAHDYIIQSLGALTPDIPIISEESEDFILPEGASRFWLVDPLDGTKSFISRKGEFTVNIALIDGNRPVLGVIDIPVTAQTYYGVIGDGACRIRDGGAREPIRTRELKGNGYAAVVSKSHLDPQTAAFLEPLAVTERVSASSSLKFCRVAEGAADIYPRFGTTMEWDTAAGHAILEAAGGRVETPDGQPFRYRKPDFRNGAFVAWGK